MRPILIGRSLGVPAQRLIIELHTQIILSNNIIQLSTIPWAAPLVLVNKNDNITRF